MGKTVLGVLGAGRGGVGGVVMWGSPWREGAFGQRSGKKPSVVRGCQAPSSGAHSRPRVLPSLPHPRGAVVPGT